MVTIVSARRVLWRSLGAADPLLPMIELIPAEGQPLVVPPADPLVTGYDGEILPYSTADTVLLIDAERDRRITNGIEYPSGSGRIIQTREPDQQNISQQMLRATAMLASGTPEAWGSGRTWLDASNANPLPLPTPDDMIQLGVAVGNHKERLIYRGYALKARLRAGETVDYTADAEWA